RMPSRERTAIPEAVDFDVDCLAPPDRADEVAVKRMQQTGPLDRLERSVQRLSNDDSAKDEFSEPPRRLGRELVGAGGGRRDAIDEFPRASGEILVEDVGHTRKRTCAR